MVLRSSVDGGCLPGNPRAAVVVVHGAAEHSGRYARVAEVLQAEGYAVYALDLRGHGRTATSTGRGRIGAGGMPEVVADVEALTRRAARRVRRLPASSSWGTRWDPSSSKHSWYKPLTN